MSNTAINQEDLLSNLLTENHFSSICSSISDASEEKIKRNEDFANADSLKKTNRSWYNALTPTYKSKLDKFSYYCQKSGILCTERLVADYSCAFKFNGFLAQGRLYISCSFLLFHSHLLSGGGIVIIYMNEIISITPERTAKIFQNAISISTLKEKYFFTSFGQRDNTFALLNHLWACHKSNHVFCSSEFWKLVREIYGDNLGFSNSDEESECSVKELLLTSSQDSVINITEVTDDSLNLVSNQGSDSCDAGCEVEEKVVVKLSKDHDEISTTDENFTSSPISPTKPFCEDILQQSQTSSSIVDELPGIGLDLSSDANDSLRINCSNDHEHFQRQYVDTVVLLNVEHVFEMLFTDSEWFRSFVRQRKTTHLKQSAWTDSSTEHDNCLSRVISYTLALNYAIGPKTSPSVETQIILPCSRAGRIRVVDCKVQNNGIPYSGSFFAHNRYCLTMEGAARTRIRICSKVVYTKSVFMVAKSMIESSAKNGLADYFRELINLLNVEAKRKQCGSWSVDSGGTDDPASGITLIDRLTPHEHASVATTAALLPLRAAQGGVKRRKSVGRVSVDALLSSNDAVTCVNTESNRRRRRFLHTVVDANASFSLPGSVGGGGGRQRLAGYLLIALALALVVCFVTLFNRLNEMEALILPLTSRSVDNADKLRQHVRMDSTATKWHQYLVTQRQLQHKELQRWSQIIDSTIATLDDMRSALVQLLTVIKSETDTS